MPDYYESTNFTFSTLVTALEQVERLREESVNNPPLWDRWNAEADRLWTAIQNYKDPDDVA